VVNSEIGILNSFDLAKEVAQVVGPTNIVPNPDPSTDPVMAAAAKHLASVTLELGGKSPVVVDASADLRHAAEHVMWGKLVNAGQTCVAPDHLYVHRSVMDRFVALCREVLAERFGADAAAVAASESLGRMVHSRHAQRVVALVDDAVAQGARTMRSGATSRPRCWPRCPMPFEIRAADPAEVVSRKLVTAMEAEIEATYADDDGSIHSVAAEMALRSGAGVGEF